MPQDNQDDGVYFPDLLMSTIQRARQWFGRLRHNPVGEILGLLVGLLFLAAATLVTGLVITVGNAVGAGHPLPAPPLLRGVVYAATAVLVVATSLWRWGRPSWRRVTMPLFGVSLVLASIAGLVLILMIGVR